MRILITGNMGYVGPAVLKHLRAMWPSAYLAGYDAGFFSAYVTDPGAIPETQLDVQHFGDVRQFPKELLGGFDAVVHLAAISNDPMGKQFEEATDEVNHRASVRLAALCAEAGVSRFVFASSCSVYGFAGDGRARSEADAVNPLTAYARSKIAAELALKQASLGDLKVRCLRFATACGASERIRLDLVLNDFVACALSRGEISVLSDGTPWRPLIDVADMARAIEWAITDEAEPNFLSLNVGASDWNFQVKDIADAVAAEIPGTRVSINTQAQPDNRSYRVDFTEFARRAPNHQPALTLPESIRRVRDQLQSIGFRDPDFRTSRFVRLGALNHLIESDRLGSDLAWNRGNPSS